MVDSHVCKTDSCNDGIILLLRRKLTCWLLIQWGIEDKDLMKTASSAGVETLLNCVPPWVFSTRNMGIVVGACVCVGWSVSKST